MICDPYPERTAALVYHATFKQHLPHVGERLAREAAQAQKESYLAEHPGPRVGPVSRSVSSRSAQTYESEHSFDLCDAIAHMQRGAWDYGPDHDNYD